jgi:hypothetical protein
MCVYSATIWAYKCFHQEMSSDLSGRKKKRTTINCARGCNSLLVPIKCKSFSNPRCARDCCALQHDVNRDWVLPHEEMFRPFCLLLPSYSGVCVYVVVVVVVGCACVSQYVHLMDIVCALSPTLPHASL